MYKSSGSYAQVLLASSEHHTSPIGEALRGAGSDLINTELGACGEKLLGSSSAHVPSNVGDFVQIGRYFSNPHYYFQVNDEYMENKLKAVLFPFLHKGHWMRTMGVGGGEYAYKLRIYNINAPDLYIPLMAFGTYVFLRFPMLFFFLPVLVPNIQYPIIKNYKSLKRFSQEALGVLFTNELPCWLLQVLLKAIAVLDVAAYGSYAFVAALVVVLSMVVLSSSSLVYAVTICECLCVGVFLVKTMKRILVAEERRCEKHSSKRRYLLLLMAAAQIPLLFWLGNVDA
ncbi:hypothetical protein NMG60_11005686 [Bertholletia excelsa]